ncbi:MAG: ATP-dependent protease subunit HslV [Bacteroidetes bacterium]|jgi:ATP-dependent HslUV protease subunit HslV|nr:ATP-dependent protease subunit HslV [Bacteroidota bacterium]MBU1423207.1 ATP-dependent protease subunit HslV [Bacteroidota bacterium]MBU2470854.1 ATP-dependent protease subunit HslV [Bacteroidota bacterium]MBU2637206.1 ATP-dependent protease subunit HslV [Bacteroidota bacterium]
MINLIKSTTVIGLTHKGKSVMGSDGQVTVGNAIMKHGARKVRKLYNDTVLAGFAGAAADAFTLFERFEDKLQEYHGNLLRAAVELTKMWRTDKYLRHLEALLAVIDKEQALIISGTGEIIEPDDGIVAIGSGGSYAVAAARMLVKYSDLSTREIVEESLKTAGDICIYTNQNITIEEL